MLVVGAASSRPQILWSESGSEADVTPKIEEREEEEIRGVRLEFFVLRSAFAWPHKFFSFARLRGRICVQEGGACVEEERVVRDASVVVRPNAGNGGDAEGCRNFSVHLRSKRHCGGGC
ncbi:hypothetical protein TraAM80_09870 [Trypanosoma rangeli]|uniref:Uncharacterized protein n=1 Tax=Trypanosoma rangeli TaxID=5698 RepID=A0A3R7LFK8_TRYRA|nr:uncharacterized protein TraAM80_09870 [Trypanosoma rangeli]RNE96308.1 hypothetical protein TraAM80_09870 [Trypanosoma rangeli]|eukprot:RNE96308.1 hypothetical protein TraAM80_09870 [Trypanosoma rangeli]